MKKLFAIVLCIYSLSLYSQCSNFQGPRNPGNFGQNTSVGSFSWTDQDKVLVSDNDRVYCGVLLGILASANTHYVTTSNHGFTVPVTANICGIQVDIEQAAGGIIIGSNIRDNSIRIIKGGAITGNNLATGNTWFGSDSYVSYGGNAETWGTTWTPADINNNNFGVAVSAHLSAGLASIFLTAAIDHIRIKVFYDNPLPVELLYFNAQQEEDQIHFEWATASEINCDYFTIEKSEDAITWNEMTRIEGNHNSNTLQTYSLETAGQHISAEYYKLCQYDHDGTKNELKTVSVSFDASLMNVYYNTTNRELWVNGGQYPGKCSVEIFDLRGNLLKTVTNEAETSEFSIPVELTTGNIYVIRISTGSATHQQKIMVN